MAKCSLQLEVALSRRAFESEIDLQHFLFARLFGTLGPHFGKLGDEKLPGREGIWQVLGEILASAGKSSDFVDRVEADLGEILASVGKSSDFVDRVEADLGERSCAARTYGSSRIACVPSSSSLERYGQQEEGKGILQRVLTRLPAGLGLLYAMETQSSELKPRSGEPAGEVHVVSHISEMTEGPGFEELIVHLRQMVNNPAYSDVVFLCSDGKRVQGIRMLLAARSKTLRSLLLNGRAETKLSEIELHGISSRSFLSVVEFLYTGELLDYLPENWSVACELLRVARFFDLPTLENVICSSRRGKRLGNGCDFVDRCGDWTL